MAYLSTGCRHGCVRNFGRFGSVRQVWAEPDDNGGVNVHDAVNGHANA